MRALNMIRLHPRAGGFISLELLYVFGSLAFFVFLLIRLAPAYVDHFQVTTSLESLRKEQGIAAKTKDEIFSLLEKRWIVEGVKNMTRDDVHVQRNGRTLEVRVEYEVVAPIIGNVSALLSFDDAIEVSGP